MFTTYQLVQDFATTHSRKIVENECQMDRQVGKVTENHEVVGSSASWKHFLSLLEYTFKCAIFKTWYMASGHSTITWM